VRGKTAKRKDIDAELALFPEEIRKTITVWKDDFGFSLDCLSENQEQWDAAHKLLHPLRHKYKNVGFSMSVKENL
jgi:Zn-dependent peptidase ImmA (M78 family)